MTFPRPRRARQQTRILVAAVAAVVALISNFSHMCLLVSAAQQPKRAKNAYMHFVAEKRPDFAKPALLFPEVGKAMGAAWRGMSEKKKAPYVKEAAADKKRFVKELAVFEKKGGVMQTKKATKKATKEPKKTRAPSGYNLFIKKRMPELKKKSKEEKVSELMTQLGKEWSKLTVAKKEPYNTQATKAKKAMEA